MHSIQFLASARPSAHTAIEASRILELFAAARRVRRDLLADHRPAPLRGKNLALLIDDPVPCTCAALLRAASDLGARVAQIRYRRRDGAPRGEIVPMARTLGRMYDAIDCGTLPAVTVREIEAAAGVPVYQGLGLDSHPLRILGDLMTLYEHALPPSTPPTIRFHGDSASPQARTFVSAARNIGFEVAAVDATPDAANDAAFVVDASGQARWPIRTRTGSIDEDRRAENHRNVIQAVLLDTLANA